MGLFFSTKEEKLLRRVYDAIDAHNLEKLKAALDDGAALEPKGYWSWLYHAANRRFADGVTLLLEKGCPVDGLGPYGSTPLMASVANNHRDVAAQLLDKGARIDATDEKGATALHLAARLGKMEMIQFLLDRGADAEARDGHMNTPADTAQKDYPRVADYLRERMTPTSAPDVPDEGWHVTDDDEVSRVSVKKMIGYRITETFNFTANLYVRIAQNMQTNAESQSSKTFNEMRGSPLLDMAHDEMILAGKQVPHPSGLDKPRAPKQAH